MTDMTKYILTLIPLLILGSRFGYQSFHSTPKTLTQELQSWQQRNKDITFSYSGTLTTIIDPKILENTSLSPFTDIDTQLSGKVIISPNGNTTLDVNLSHTIYTDPELTLQQQFTILNASGIYIKLDKQFSNASVELFPTLFLREQFFKNHQNKRVV
jgi:hypothetical protein